MIGPRLFQRLFLQDRGTPAIYFGSSDLCSKCRLGPGGSRDLDFVSSFLGRGAVAPRQALQKKHPANTATQLVSLFILVDISHGELLEEGGGGLSGEPWLGSPPASGGSDGARDVLHRVNKRTVTVWAEMHRGVTSDHLKSFRQEVQFKVEDYKRSEEKDKVHTKPTATVEEVLRRPGVQAATRPCPTPGRAVGPPVPS